MDDPKKLTVRSLRLLARKHVVAGYSRLRKEELVKALKKIPGAFRAAVSKKPTEKKPRQESIKRAARKAPAVQSAARAPRGGSGKSQPRPVAEVPSKTQQKTPEKVAPVARVIDALAAAGESLPEILAAPAPISPAANAAPESGCATTAAINRDRSLASRFSRGRRGARSAEPLSEGFFMARAGESDLRRPPLSASKTVSAPEQPEAFREHLGELPTSYADDSVVAVARDPHTLFVFWSFQAHSVRTAADGFTAPRTALRVLEGQALVREDPLELSSQGFYVHGLTAGRTYRVEILMRSADGRTRLLGASTQDVSLPSEGPSPDTAIRFLHVPQGLPAPQVARLVEGNRRAPVAGERARFISWDRISLPSSGELIRVNERLAAKERSTPIDERGRWASSPSGRGLVPSGRSGRPSR